MAKGRRSNKGEISTPNPTSPETSTKTHVDGELGKSASEPFFSRVDWLTGLIVLLISLAAYLYTLAPDVTLEDSGELAVGSMYAGVPHPPGYPMWTIYSWFFTKILPFSNIAWRVAVSSAVAAALSSGLLALMVSRGSNLILSSISQFKGMSSKHIQTLGIAAGMSSGLIFAFNGFIWSQAVIVEVYTLSFLTFTLTLTFLMRWFFRPKERLYLYLAYFSFGLCFVNHQTLILGAVGIEILILLADQKLGRDFLTGNCSLYIVGLALSLKGAGDASTGNPGLFVLFNFVGSLLMATLITITIKLPRPELKLLAGGAYFAVALCFGLLWDSALGKQQFAQANTTVKLWAFLNLVILLALIAHSWINRNKDEDDEGLLTNWMALLNTRAAWVAAALLYFYMPIASMTNPPMNWAYPRTLQGFKHAITRGQYDRIMPSNLTRMFIDHSHIKNPQQTNSNGFNGGQLGVYIDEARQEFSLSYLALAFIPLAFIHRMQLREFRWILSLTGIFVSFTLILIYLINPTADELNRHLNKVFFAATHIFIAGGIGLGVAIIGATLCKPETARNITLFLGGLIIWEVFETWHIYNTTVFAMKHAAAFTGLILLLILVGMFFAAKFNTTKRTLIMVATLTFCVLPLRPALNNWAENEQRNHLFGYWYGHDMFTPPFDTYPEMERDAILFGGTDPGRFCPTYMIFCESFIASRNKRDPDFDRRDVYLITQNALADGTYLQYIRAHYNRSAQQDPKFFSELAAAINKSSKRMHFNLLLFLGLLSGAIMIIFAFSKYDKSQNRKHTAGVGAWGSCLVLLCLAGFTTPLNNLSASADKFFGKIGVQTEEKRRNKSIYPPKEINTPSSYDNQVAFAAYYTDAKERMLKGALKAGEDVRLVLTFQCTNTTCGFQASAVINQQTAPLLKQLEQSGGQPCQRCGSIMPIPEPQVSVQGTTAVMDINGRLAKTIFENNPDHEFYVEESFPLNWMYPHLRPFGIIMKLEREPIDDFTEATFEKDRRFWGEYSKRLIGDWITEETGVSEICDWAERTYKKHDLKGFTGSKQFIRDNDAQKGFSKLRSAIAGLYSWRYLTTQNQKLKKRYAKEAVFAYKQAFAFGPINPETVYKFINMLTYVGRHSDAIRLATTYYRLDPANQMSLIYLKQALQNSEVRFHSTGDYVQAIKTVEQLHDIDPKGNHLIRRDFYKRQQNNDAFLLQAFNKQPSNSTNFIQAIYIHGRHKNTNAVIKTIDTFTKFAGDDPKKLTLIKNSYGLIGRWKKKEVIDQRLTEIEPDRYETWFDLAQTRIQLGKTNQATGDLRTALQKHRDSESNSTDIRTAMMTNDLFKPFLEHPDIRPFLKKAP